MRIIRRDRSPPRQRGVVIKSEQFSAAGREMLHSVAKVVILVFSWMFVIGVAGTVLLVIPVAAYQLFSVLFEKDHPDELNPSVRR